MIKNNIMDNICDVARSLPECRVIESYLDVLYQVSDSFVSHVDFRLFDSKLIDAVRQVKDSVNECRSIYINSLKFQ